MYTVTVEGEVIGTTNDFKEVLQIFNEARKETDKPVVMTKINMKGDKER